VAHTTQHPLKKERREDRIEDGDGPKENERELCKNRPSNSPHKYTKHKNSPAIEGGYKEKKKMHFIDSAGWKKPTCLCVHTTQQHIDWMRYYCFPPPAQVYTILKKIIYSNRQNWRAQAS